ncbi:MAG: 2-succinyl-5-enolpyruvyl-6-hydroxy-3-cyclohexene-1-carboxylic-acid synthase [Chloroflexota bacterium]
MVAVFVDELVRSGVHNFSICPGSRSAPLALLIAQHPGARVWMHLDERSAAFFGLGLAKASGSPVALLCSSGTAAANFLPAVVEARHAGVPLLVLTADRPPELQASGSLQTIDQARLFGEQVKWCVDLPAPEASPEMLRYARTLACRAAAVSGQAPAGPVHLNWHFREPLVPDTPNWASEARPGLAPYVQVTPTLSTLEPSQVAALVDELAGKQGLLVCGPLAKPEVAPAVGELAQALGWPVLADPLSGLRSGDLAPGLVIDAYDAVLQTDPVPAELASEVVLRLGAYPTCKQLQRYLECQADTPLLLVAGDGAWQDPTHLAARSIAADEAWFCHALAAELRSRRSQPSPPSPLARAWRRANTTAREGLASMLAACTELFEGKVLAELAGQLPDGAILFASNSMPIRDMDTFFPAQPGRFRLLANRGASGIDGVVSSALGAAAAGMGQAVLVIGDVAFYHDLNGLLAARRHELNLTVVLLNNDGGGIFSFLPQARETADGTFDLLFGTPHAIDFGALVRGHDGRHALADSWPAFRAQLGHALDSPGLNVVEVRTNRQRNVELHHQAWAAASAELRNLWPVAAGR